MIKRDIQKINTGDKNRRQSVETVKKFLDTDSELDGKILVLYGLRRTGKTTIMEQVVSDYRENETCAFYEIQNGDTMDDVRDIIVKEREKGTTLICLDELTKAEDFITNSAVLPDIFAKEGIRILAAGTDSLGFSFAEGNELFDRTERIRTTYIPFAEHAEVLRINDIDDYIMYGGLMRKSASEMKIRDYESARKYLDSAVAGNIASSIEKDPHDSELKKLSKKEIETIIEKMVEIYSGIFNKEQMQKDLRTVSINGMTDLLLKSEYKDYVRFVSENRRNITEDFTKIINADTAIRTEITDLMVLEFEKYLIEMDLLSAITKKEFRFSDEFGWRESPDERDYYIIQPAIKYNHLTKGKEFIEKEDYYQSLPQDVKELLKNKLDEKIKGDMTEQIIVYDVSKDLPRERYFVCKPEFYVNGQKKGEYDMLIYDKKEHRYWGFEVKHTKNPHEKQERHLKDPVLREIIDEKYGEQENVAVLYRGESFVSDTGTVYLNISDFLKTVHKHQDMEVAFSTIVNDIGKSHGKKKNQKEMSLEEKMEWAKKEAERRNNGKDKNIESKQRKNRKVR